MTTRPEVPLPEPTRPEPTVEPYGNVLTPPLHPEPHNMKWSRLELESIRAYGERCWCAGYSVAAQAPTPTQSAEVKRYPHD